MKIIIIQKCIITFIIIHKFKNISLIKNIMSQNILIWGVESY